MKTRLRLCVGFVLPRCAAQWRAVAAVVLASFAAAASFAQGSLLGVEFGGVGKPAPVPTGYTGPVRKDFVAPTAPKNGPAPFLTEAIDWEMESKKKEDAFLFLPTKAKIEEPFYDLPFAVNVPFEVPFDSGTVRAFFDVNIIWDEPERAAKVGDYGLFSDRSGWRLGRQGVYRLDGAPIPAENVEWEYDRKSADATVAPPGASFPFLLVGTMPAANGRSEFRPRLDINTDLVTATPRVPFRGEQNRSIFATTRPLALRTPQPGWHVLWFTLNPTVRQWPTTSLRADDTLRAKIIVHYMVGRRERGDTDYFYEQELNYLWAGADLKLPRPLDPNLVRVHTVEIPIVLRRDGWMLAKIEATRLTGEFQDRSKEEATASTSPSPLFQPKSATVVKGAANVAARSITANFQIDNFEREESTDPWPVRPASTIALTWDVSVPTEIPDGGVGGIVARGGITERGLEKNIWERPFTENFGIPPWLHSPTGPERVRDPLYASWLVESVHDLDKSIYLRDWAARLGDPSATKFFSAGIKNSLPPRNPGDEKKHWIFAKPIAPEELWSTDPDRRRILYKDMGPQPLYAFQMGAWNVECYYRRKKDMDRVVSGTPAAGPVAVVDEKDEFWTWFPKYSRLLRQKLGEVQQWETEVAVAREAMQQERRTARVLLDAVQAASDPGSFEDWFATSATRAEFSEAMFARLIRKAGQANAAAFAHRTAIQQRMALSRQAHEAILAEIDRVYDRYIDRHPELAIWRRHQRGLLQQVDFKLALGSGDLGLFQEAMARADLQPGTLQPEALMALANLQLENGDPVGALEGLRIVVRQQPDNADARERVRQIECSLLKVALEKSHGAIADARRHFYGYLKDRGYGEKDHAWVGGVRARGLARYDSESAWAVFTTGVTGSVSGILGRPEEEARALDATERDMTVAYLGAQTILHLRVRGHTLSKIKEMSTARIREELRFGAPNAPVMGRDRARDLGLAIHSAFRLPELQALMADDFVSLRFGLSKGYWNAKDVGNTWAEWVGDLTSPKNLAMFLMPASIGRVGGKLQGVTYWTRAEARLLQGATRTGAVDSGTMVVAQMLGWQRALGALGGTKAGESFIKLLERSQKYQESLGLFGQTGWTLGKMVSVMALQGLAVHSAEELGGPRAALAVEAMLLFAGDTDLLIKFFDASRISRQSARMALDGFRVTAERQRWSMLNIKERMIDLEHAAAARAKGGAIPPRRVADAADARPRSSTERVGAGPATDPTRPKTIQMKGEGGRPGTAQVPGGSGTGSGTSPAPGSPGGAADDAVSNALTDGNPFADPRPVIPNGQPGNDSLICLKGATEAADQGVDDGAIAAGKSLSNDLDTELNSLSQKMDEAEKIANRLQHAGPPPPPPSRTPAKRIVSSPEAGNYELAAHPGENDLWVRAERAMAEEDFKEAEDLFLQMKRKLARDTASGAPVSPFELPLSVLERRIAQAQALKGSSRPVVNRELSEGVIAAIPDSEVDDILKLPRRQLPKEDMGASGMMGFAGEKFMVKELVAGEGRIITDSDYLLWAVEGEIVSGEIARTLGFATPGTNVKVKWRMGDKGPEMEAAELVYRRVMGTTKEGGVVYGLGVHKLSDAELYHVRDQLAEHRVLAILLGDYDRKPDNYMLLGGLVHGLDAGQADVRAHKALAAFKSKASPTTIEGNWGADHWWVNSFNHIDDAKEGAKLQQIFMVESSLTYEHAAPAVEKIKKRLKDPAQLAELRESIRSAYRSIHHNNPRFANADPRLLEFELNRQADAVIEAMRERMPGVEEAMKKLNRRTGRPVSRTAKRGRRPQRLAPVLPYCPEERLAA